MPPSAFRRTPKRNGRYDGGQRRCPVRALRRPSGCRCPPWASGPRRRVWAYAGTSPWRAEGEIGPDDPGARLGTRHRHHCQRHNQLSRRPRPPGQPPLPPAPAETPIRGTRVSTAPTREHKAGTRTRKGSDSLESDPFRPAERSHVEAECLSLDPDLRRSPVRGPDLGFLVDMRWLPTAVYGCPADWLRTGRGCRGREIHGTRAGPARRLRR